MARPKHTRILRSAARTIFFKPCSQITPDIPAQRLAQEELEAIRLADFEGLCGHEAAVSMGVSRHTFGRILASARQKVARALLMGESIEIRGGTYAYTTSSESLLKENRNMRIAISAEGPTMDDMVDGRFGRAAGFVIYDTETDTTEYVDNGAAQMAAQGAGFMAAESLSAKKVDVVLSGYVGPKAFQALQVAQIKVVQDMDDQTVGEALAAFRAGQADVLVGHHE